MHHLRSFIRLAVTAGFCLGSACIAASPASAQSAEVAPAAEQSAASPDELIRQLHRESDADKRHELLLELREMVSPEVAALTLELLQSGDPAQRSEGVVLLAGGTTGEREGLRRLRELARTEQDARVLAQIATSVSPSLFPPLERAQMTARMHLLTHDGDASVRAASVLALSRWDWSPATETVELRALYDTDAEVRYAAMQSLMVTRHYSESLKQRLFEVIDDGSQGSDHKNFARMVLRRMPQLSDQEYRQVGLDRLPSRKTGR